MSEAKHTPGPWQWHYRGDQGYELIHPKSGWLIVMDFVRHGMRGAQPRFAKWEGVERGRMGGIMHKATELVPLDMHPDASLIAAAPDLLASLLECLAIVRLQNGNLHPDTNAIQDRANAAIEKATGAK